jgi:hypothetical protein
MLHHVPVQGHSESRHHTMTRKHRTSTDSELRSPNPTCDLNLGLGCARTVGAALRIILPVMIRLRLRVTDKRQCTTTFRVDPSRYRCSDIAGRCQHGFLLVYPPCGNSDSNLVR